MLSKSDSVYQTKHQICYQKEKGDSNMRDQLTKKEIALYEQGLENVRILKTRSDVTRILFMMIINIVIAVGTTLPTIMISIGLVTVISLVFYYFDLPMKMNLIYSWETVAIYVIIMMILYYLGNDLSFILVIKIITNVYFCTTLSNKLGMTERYCKHMLRKVK
nr:MAG TPA: hypothetical protein [Caudoviricetes sp.]